MPGPRSIQYRLTLLFFAITLTAFAGIYLYVVPQLETNLREQKLRDLSDSARLTWLSSTFEPIARTRSPEYRRAESLRSRSFCSRRLVSSCGTT